MRIAICISGQPRTFMETFPKFQEFFLNENSQHQIDVFIHVWSEYYAFNITKQKLTQLYNPKKIVSEYQRHFSVSKKMRDKNPNHRNISNVLSMYYSIKLCNQLKIQHEMERQVHYDCVIRYRHDILLQAPIKIEECQLNKIVIPRYGDFTGINDQLAYSNSENMNKYCQLFDHINSYIDAPDMFINPEILLKYHLNKMGMTLHRPEINYVLWCHGKMLDNKVRDPQ